MITERTSMKIVFLTVNYSPIISGGFGYAFKKVVCVVKGKPCDACLPKFLNIKLETIGKR